MNLETLDGEKLMSVQKISPDGNRLMIEGKIMDSIPIRAVLTPAAARAAIRLLDFRTFFFLLTILFRK